jgi:hypothetical protein
MGELGSLGVELTVGVVSFLGFQTFFLEDLRLVMVDIEVGVNLEWA